ncbi:hypothetical protein Aasi_0250 [Candidatus Amoebophilus asiaticus 5a2]|uniref:Uncharacterized protein n=1 Tax=Amoebophilus asiaticus (strain 5a2) TaxID=452471 RepID=B3ER41_AMOA5|nr:hypothetical protein Aasi_0250 [Candidatus Amoebophilus asiaticus 5a2]
MGPTQFWSIQKYGFLGRELFTNVYFLELFYEIYFVKINPKLRAIFLKIQLDRKDL